MEHKILLDWLSCFFAVFARGEVAERFKAHAWKACVG